MVEYYGEGRTNGCMGQAGGPHAQPFWHGEWVWASYIHLACLVVGASLYFKITV